MRFKILVAIFLSFATAGWSQSTAPLVALQSIQLPLLHDGDFDHFAVDLASHRLFLTAEKNSAVEVFDLRSNELIQTLTDIQEAHSLVYRPDVKKLFVVDGGAAKVKIYDGDSYKPVGS